MTEEIINREAGFKIEKETMQMMAEHLIGGMPLGEWRWTVPWAMWIRTDGACFLNEAYTAESNSGGTVCMRVKRTEKGYIVDVSGVYDRKTMWHPCETPGFVTDEKYLYGKVIDMIGSI